MADDATRTITLTAVGDIMFDTRLRSPRVFLYQPASAACGPSARPLPCPFINDADSVEWLNRNGISTDGVRGSSHVAQSIALDLPRESQEFDFPFRLIGAELVRADLVFGNLECPLSVRGRPTKNDVCYRADPAFAKSLADANIKAVSFSNNHCMDYGESAFLDTLEALKLNGIRVVGAGRSLAEVCRPALFEIHGIKIAFFAFNNIGPETAYALPDESGVIPLNEVSISKTVGLIREQVDFVFASVHWGREELGPPSDEIVRLAHLLVDQGADAVLGHHSHVPGSIEIYNSKPIFYSLGNFIFGHTHSYWTDNVMAQFTLRPNRDFEVELIPIGSLGVEQYQPLVLDGARGADVIQMVSVLSSPFGTIINSADGKHVIFREAATEVELVCGA